MRSIDANRTPLRTKAMWRVTFHMYMSILPWVGAEEIQAELPLKRIWVVVPEED